MTEIPGERHLLPAPLRRIGYVLSGGIVAWLAYGALKNRAPTQQEILYSVGKDPIPEKPHPKMRSDAGWPLDISSSGPSYTNESLRPYLRNQEKTLGIQRILRPEAGEGMNAHDVEQQMEAQFGQAVQLRQTPSVRLSGSKPDLLSRPESAPGNSAGKPLLESSATANSPTYRLEGAVVRDGAELRELWTQFRTTERPPSVDFERRMLVAVYALGAGAKPGIEIVSIKPSEGRLLVRYRLVPASARAASRQTRILDRSEDPVFFVNDSASEGPASSHPPPSPRD